MKASAQLWFANTESKARVLNSRILNLSHKLLELSKMLKM